jgi:1-phosphofructokinase family hexose kinase
VITVLCANTGIDKTFEVEGFQIGGFHHPRRVRTAPGGKGVNVARVLRALGAEVVLTGFAGGAPAQYIATYLRREGIVPDLVRIAEDSRLCLNILDTVRGTGTRLDEVGPLVTPTEIDQLGRKWQALMQRSSLAVISGSAPRGVPFDLYNELILLAREARVPVMLDAHDEMLRQSIDAGPTVLKPNLEELSTLCGHELSVPEGVLKASRDLLNRGVRVVLCSLGADGAIITTRDHGEWHARAPQIQEVSPVGSGDAMVAGFAAAMHQGRSLEDCVRWAIAAGAACAATFGAGFATLAQVEALVSQVSLEPLSV